MLEAASEQFSGDGTRKDFWLRLPEHISFQPGSEVVTVLHPSPQMLHELCLVALEVNGRRLAAVDLESSETNAAASPGIRLSAPVPEGLLMAGWNQVGLRFVLRQSADFTPASQLLMSWKLHRAESHLLLAFDRLPLFPELSRFPASFIEEQLLEPKLENREQAAELVLLVPGQRSDVHLRACAVLGARFGQNGYFRKVRLGLIERWREETTNSSVIVVAERSELADLPFPAAVAGRVGSLDAGQGLLAEFIVGLIPGQRRWLVASGADSLGLEKAILAAGSAEAIASLPPNPAVIDRYPELPAAIAEEQPLAPRVTQLRDLHGGPIELRGIYRSEKAISGWKLAPGLVLGSDSVLNLEFSHAPELRADRSYLEVQANGVNLGRVVLAPENSVVGTASLPLPKGLAGQDPMTLTFHAHLDLGPSSCQQRQQEAAWLRIEGGSSLEITPQVVSVSGFQDLDSLLARDRGLLGTAFLVPAAATLPELSMLFRVAAELGRMQPSAPVQWPEVAGFSPQHPPAAIRLESRTVWLLGAISQWSQALPASARLAIAATSNQQDSIHIQGRRTRVSKLEPTLVLAQILPSPWSSNEVLVAAGNWRTFDAPALPRLFSDRQTRPYLQGNVCAVDAQGRATSYDTRRILPESFAERIRRCIPAGLSAESTHRLLSQATTNGHRANGWNRLVFGVSGALLLLVVGARLILQWGRLRRQKRVFLQESPFADSP